MRMLRYLLLPLVLLLCSPAEAQKTKAQIQTEINSFFADNTTGQITPAKLRTVTTDLLNSYVDWLTCTGSGGLVYWSAGTPTCLSAGTSGQMLKTNGGAAAPSWANFTSSLVAGTGITITGTTTATISLTDQLVAGGPIGSGTVTPVITYNAQGQLTVVSQATITPPFSAVTGTAAVTQGGTGLTGGTSGGVLYFSGASTLASSAALAANQIMIGGGAGAAPTTFACATTTTVVHGGTPPTCSQIVFGDLNSSLIATAANYYAGLCGSCLIPTTVIYPSEVTITYGATTTVDFSTLINGVVTLTGNITTLTLSNVQAGKAGQIRLIQDATGSRTWPAGGNTILKYAGGTLPALSTTANAIDVLTYSCSTATFCVASLLKDVRNP